MTIVKISSIACSSCIILNNTLEKILENYKVHIKEYDYDFVDKHFHCNFILGFVKKNNVWKMENTSKRRTLGC